MRRPKLSEFDDGDGMGPDYEEYCERMGDYEDSERDRQLEEQWEHEEKMKRTEERERYADYSDQEKDSK